MRSDRITLGSARVEPLDHDEQNRSRWQGSAHRGELVVVELVEAKVRIAPGGWELPGGSNPWQNQVMAKWTAGRCVTDLRYRLAARISSDDPAAARAVLHELLPAATITDDQGELIVEAELAGASAKELNRSLLSALRRAQKKTRLRAQWTSPDGTIERYFDYVLKKVIPSP